MPGGGTRLAITRDNPPPARLLDVTRLISRAGRVLTGVDRVERAYLAQLLKLETPVFGLARVLTGYALLDRAGLAGLLTQVDGARPWGRPDRIARLSRRRDPMQQAAEADTRRLAAAGCLRGGLGRMLRRELPAGTAYLNTGHSNLTNRTLRAVRRVPGARIAVLIHDTIPLDFPQFQREGTVARFQGMLRRTARMADLIICNSEATRADVARALDERGIPCPETVVAHLGVTPPVADAAALPEGVPGEGPYFVAVGTIEPRKNHALLLDVWEALAKENCAPRLYICGARGWRNEAVFARLDALPEDGPIRELSGLSDGALAALIAGAEALLLPSHAEGFGLPPVEAAALGTDVILSELPVFHEVLGNIPVYLGVKDTYSWVEAIKKRAEVRGTGTEAFGGFEPPRWQDHFNTVLRLT